MPTRRKRLSGTQRRKKELEWQRFARKKGVGSLKIDWREVPDADSEGIAVAPKHAAQAVTLLKGAGLEFWSLGPLERVCWVLEHSEV